MRASERIGRARRLLGIAGGLAWVLAACSGPSAASDGGTPSSSLDLGALPDGLEIRLPAAPTITREVEVTSADAFTEAASVPGTRIRVTAGFDGRAFVRADDVEILVDDGVAVGSLLVERAHARILVRGGRWESLELQVPARFFPGPEEWREEWLVEDVLFEGVEVDAPDSAFLIRGRRVAIVDSEARAVRYSVWCGQTDEFQSEDIVLVGNDFASEGPEATVRLVQVNRAVTVDNRLSNGAKHNYRVHGRSDLAYAARNVLVNTGVMLGTLPGDALGRVWFDENRLHHVSPSLFLADPSIERLVSRGNRAFSDAVGCWLCGDPPDGWDVADNLIEPYAPPD
ncbi:MAG TPA: hypothetical protein RMH99_24565 [Sandaracinaceae bacterium LLY-WYZ-13_1]|nr:hypothetical protein [Sandaracinaceae bacterium LLY-WYZ-13_1]